VRRAKLNPQARLSIRRQCALLSLNRSTAYYEPAPTPDEDLALMRLIDELYTARPIYGSRKWWSDCASAATRAIESECSG
jgi:putative transposase